MDQQKLRTLVFEKTGVKIDIDDPVFALVALNEAVLAEAVERHVALLDEATAALARQAEALQPDGAVFTRPSAPRTPASASAAGAGLGAPSPGQLDRRLIGLGAGAALLTAILVLAGQALLFRPAPMPAPVIQARELTAEQSAAIEHAEKLARIVQKLDQKTRNTIQAELQKP